MTHLHTSWQTCVRKSPISEKTRPSPSKLAWLEIRDQFSAMKTVYVEKKAVTQKVIEITVKQFSIGKVNEVTLFFFLFFCTRSRHGTTCWGLFVCFCFSLKVVRKVFLLLLFPRQPTMTFAIARGSRSRVSQFRIAKLVRVQTFAVRHQET